MTSKAKLRGIDSIIHELDNAMRTVFAKPTGTRENPATSIDMGDSENALSEAEATQSIELMRVNHVGEVCAQALYQGQALTARSQDVKDKMSHAADEEVDHLHWCEQRIEELGGRVSLLNPLWYAGSLALGATAGAFGDKWSLGFLKETETQVEKHLEEHLTLLPEHDLRSRAIVEQMKLEEAEHAQMAHDNGAAELPSLVKAGMNGTAKIMKLIATKI